MAIKYVSIFEYMKKYELPLPLWMYHPELEQDSSQWDSLGQRMMVRRLRRFLEGRTRHEQSLYYRLFPLPMDWDAWLPSKEMPPEDAYVGAGELQLRKWQPQCPPWDGAFREDAGYLSVGELGEAFSVSAYSSFFIRLQKELPQNTQVFAMEQLLMLGYALYRGRLSLFDKLQLAEPGDRLWQDTWKKCMSCRSAEWKRLLPHLLGLGLYRKFTQDNLLRQMLQETGELPIVYVDPGNKLLGGEFKNGKFCGENLYGVALMQVRSELNRVYDNIVLCLGDPNKKEEEAAGEEEAPFDFPF